MERKIEDARILSEEIEYTGGGCDYLTYEVEAKENGAVSIFFLMKSLDNDDVYIRRAAVLDPAEEQGDEKWCEDMFVYSYANANEIPEDEKYLRAFSDIASEIRTRTEAFYDGEYERKYPARKYLFSQGKCYEYDGKMYFGVFAVVKEGTVTCFGQVIDQDTGENTEIYTEICMFPYSALKQAVGTSPVDKFIPCLSDDDIVGEVSLLLYKKGVTNGIYPFVKDGSSRHIFFPYRGKDYEIIVRRRESTSKFAMLITYSFDIDYVCVPCETEKEALNVLQKYLQDEIKTVQEEQEYTPQVVKIGETETVLSYADEEIFGKVESDNFCDHDFAIYKVIEIGHNYIKKT